MKDSILTLILGGVLYALLSMVFKDWRSKKAQDNIIDLTGKLNQQKNDEAPLAKKADDAVKEYEDAKANYKPDNDGNGGNSAS